MIKHFFRIINKIKSRKLIKKQVESKTFKKLKLSKKYTV